MGLRHINVTASTPAGTDAVYGLLADGSTWPRWSPIESFELERPGDTAARRRRGDPRLPQRADDRTRSDPRTGPEPAARVRVAVGPARPRLRRRGGSRGHARRRDDHPLALVASLPAIPGTGWIARTRHPTIPPANRAWSRRIRGGNQRRVVMSSWDGPGRGLPDGGALWAASTPAWVTAACEFHLPSPPVDHCSWGSSPSPGGRQGSPVRWSPAPPHVRPHRPTVMRFGR